MTQTMIKCFGTLSRPFEEWKVGQKFITKKKTLDKFILQSYLHTTGYAHENLFGDKFSNPKPLVPALLTTSIADALIVSSGIIEDYAIALVGVDALSAKKPVYAGDTIYVEFEVTETKQSKSKPDRGIVTTKQTVYNQQEEVVLEYVVKRMLKKSTSKL
eukprot:snap_masked-scaffold_4-processed-gene-5.47-mRNA-1 protein AED:0.02 eAED:0.02 QI:0/-1/0/1/-1/1/1/0/158